MDTSSNPPSKQDDKPKDAVSPQEFRDAMSRFGAAVHIITTNGRAGLCGFTASAVCSVSDDPPTVLICHNRASEMNSAFKKNGVFCINTLSADDEELSNCFAGFTGVTMAQRFDLGDWGELTTGSPVLDASLVSMDCTIVNVLDISTHSVMFGRVDAVTIGKRKPALLYLNRAYRSL